MAISHDQAPAFVKLVGKEPKNIKLALIENAADAEHGDKPWLYSNREAIRSLGFQITPVNLQRYLESNEGLLAILEQQDVIWIGGGNVYYLRWILKQTKADVLIKELVKSGIVYGGGSAGAVVAGPTVKGFESADDPRNAPEIIDDGLMLTDVVIVPHSVSEEDGSVMAAIQNQLVSLGHNTVAITDDQALVIDGQESWIVP